MRTLEERIGREELPGLTAYATKEMHSALKPMQDVLGALVQVRLDTDLKEYDQAVVPYANSRLFVVLVIAGGVLFALGFGTLVARSIVGELGIESGTAATLARGVVHGDLTVAIHLRPGDTTSLTAQLKRMQDSLMAMVTMVHQSSANVASACE